MDSLTKITNLYKAQGVNYGERDLARYDFASKLVKGDSVLNIGCGTGFFEHLLTDKYKNLKIRALDNVIHSKFIKNDTVENIYMDLTDCGKLPGMDTVFCMEVIEHLEEKFNEAVLQKLRDCALKRFVVTVPLDEPFPLYHQDKKGGHRQSFSLEKIQELFPYSLKTVFERKRVPWIFILEDRGQDYGSHDVCGNEEFLKVCKI